MNLQNLRSTKELHWSRCPTVTASIFKTIMNQQSQLTCRALLQIDRMTEWLLEFGLNVNHRIGPPSKTSMRSGGERMSMSFIVSILLFCHFNMENQLMLGHPVRIVMGSLSALNLEKENYSVRKSFNWSRGFVWYFSTVMNGKFWPPSPAIKWR